ncbi:MAG TPA: TIGR03085 family metal-binding protein [Pseudonocardiaceae bacterium]|jgi:uncharacterized protein (TIGR03085 family)|nr:TIGR03085 family metal-binding protein [Pseudonocardiaceae bacterium]
MGLAVAERRELSDLFAEVGPDQPTLCEGWQTRDLAAHLVIRERRLDAAPGIMLAALSGHTKNVQDRYAAKPWEELVALVRTGPGALSPYAIPGLSELTNGGEYFVHHEDVRRAQPNWEPRPADPVRDEMLWKMVGRTAKLAYRRSPVGVRLRRPDGTSMVVKTGPAPVTIVGEPAELVMFSFGRSAARVTFEGETASISAVQDLKRGM